LSSSTSFGIISLLKVILYIYIPSLNPYYMKNIVLFGPPGSGKGTQANNIISKYHLIHLSTGDMLRAEISAQTTLGLEARSIMDKGDLVPDSVVIGMIENKLNANPNAEGFVFDGFPRTVGQAEALDALLAKKSTPIQKVLSLKVSEAELTKRILQRGKTSDRADDQNPEIVKNRVAEYRTKTQPLVNYYASQGKLVEIQGEGTVEHISDMLFHEIDMIPDKVPFPAEEIALPVAKVEKSLPAAKEEKALPAPAKASVKKPTDKVPFPLTTVEKKVPAKKAAPKKKAPAKKAVKKAAPKKAAKKAVKKAPAKKVVAKKPVKKAAPKKAVKKAAPKKVVKKAAPKKAVKKAAPKKVVKKTAKKAVKKVAPKKRATAKKVAKKAAPKKAAKKAIKKPAPKKVVKKAAKKAVKKAPAKKAVKKLAAKKKAPAKKTVKKAAPKKAVKKAPAKKKGKK
jgi:adenylate kinase